MMRTNSFRGVAAPVMHSSCVGVSSVYSSNAMTSPLIVLVEHPSVAFFPVHSPMIMFSVSACSSQKYALRAVRYVITKGPKEMPVQISLPPKAEVAVDDCELVPVEMTVVDADDVFVLVAVEEPVSVTDDDAVRVPDDDTVVVSDIETVDVAVVVADSLNVVTTGVLCEVVAVDDAVADCDDVAVDVPDTEPVLVADECTDDVTVVLAVVTSQSRNTPALASVIGFIQFVRINCASAANFGDQFTIQTANGTVYSREAITLRYLSNQLVHRCCSGGTHTGWLHEPSSVGNG